MSYRIAYENRDGLKKIWRVDIKDGVAHVYSFLVPVSFPSDSKTTWNLEYLVGQAVDCDIAFDGRWYKNQDINKNNRWEFITFGDPYIATVNAGALTVRQGQGSATTLAPDSVTKCAMLRGWKNVAQWNHDQGIIVAYLRNGAVMYRNYCQQPPDQPALWEIEREITDIPAPAQYVSLFRGNDYTVHFTGSSGGQMWLWSTSRNWANMAIEEETVTAAPASVTVDFLPVEYLEYHEYETITAVPSSIDTDFGYGLTDNSFTQIYNQPVVIDGIEDWGKELIVKTQHDLRNLYASDFEIVDEFSRKYYPDTIEQIGDRTYRLSYLNLNNFNNAGVLPTLKFLGTATTNILGNLYEPFQATFTPQNLEPTDIPLPEVEVIWNE